MRRKKLFLGITILIFGILLGVTLTVRLDIFSSVHSQSAKPEASQAAPALSASPALEDAVINVANTTGRAVVSIAVEKTTKIKGGKRIYIRPPGGQAPFGEEDPFHRFFGDFFGEIPDREFKQGGFGSGVIINPEGYILTNEHVVGEADKITVILPDGRQFSGEVKGKDVLEIVLDFIAPLAKSLSTST